MEINCIFVALLNIVQKQKNMDTILKAITYRYNIVSVIHYQFEIVMANLLNLITLIFGLGTGEIIILIIGILLIVLLYKLIKKLYLYPHVGIAPFCTDGSSKNATGNISQPLTLRLLTATRISPRVQIYYIFAPKRCRLRKILLFSIYLTNPSGRDILSNSSNCLFASIPPR